MTTPPHYVPVNEYVYAAALSGCVAGAMGSQPVTSVHDETYSDTADNAVAFAEEFDTLWGGASLDVVQYEAIIDSCTSYWRGRIPQSSVPDEYEPICDALITMVNEVDATAIAAGATPPAWPPAAGGGLTNTAVQNSNNAFAVPRNSFVPVDATSSPVHGLTIDASTLVNNDEFAFSDIKNVFGAPNTCLVTLTNPGSVTIFNPNTSAYGTTASLNTLGVYYFRYVASIEALVPA